MKKIIEIFKNRETIDKYSYVAPMSEIKENDYNLNIPRYVDTFEEEEPIDIKEVQANIKKIDEVIPNAINKSVSLGIVSSKINFLIITTNAISKNVKE